MSEFIYIAPSDYTRMDVDTICAITGMGLGELTNFIQRNYYDSDLQEKLVNAGVTPEGKELHEFRLVNDSELWAKFIDS